MRAITYDSFGPAEDVLSLVDVPIPDPSEGEVQVTLAFSGVNPSDVKARAGARPGVTKPPFPTICPHSDGAGTITAVGAGVDPARVGEKVWIWNGQWQRPWGTATERINLPADQAVALPEGVDLETGASLGIPGLTAAHTVFGGGDIAGQTMLIHGGSGSVGHLAVQLARWGGAKVIATASPADFERCRNAGADCVLHYRSTTLSSDILDANGGCMIDRIVDVEFGQNISVNAEVIAPNGSLVAYGSAKNMVPELPFGALLFKAITIDIVLIYILSDHHRARAIDILHKALLDRALTCPVAKVYPLADTANAHVAVETGGRKGAILVNCQP